MRTLLAAAALALSLLHAGAPRAQPSAAADVPVEAFFGPVQMAQPRLSPSGRYLSFLRTAADTGRNLLLVVDLEDLQQSKVLSYFRDADITDARWVSDDLLVFSLTDQAVAAGDIDFAPGLYAVARTGGAPQPLVRVRWRPSVDGGSASRVRPELALDPNHRLLAVPQDGRDDVIVGRLERGAGDLTTVLPLRLDVKTQRTRALGVDVPEAAVNRWLFDADGEPRVAIVTADGRMRVHWRPPGSDGWQKILDAERLQLPWEPFGVDAAGTLYVVHDHGPDRLTVLSRYDPARRGPAATPLVEVPGFDFRGELVSERRGGPVLGVRALTDGEITVWTDPGMKALQALIDQRLPDRANRLSCRRCTRDDRVVLVESWTDRDPGIVFVWLGARQELLRVGRVRPAIDPARMAVQDLQRIRARDGRPLPVWLTLPQRPAGTAPPPAVVLVHGGPMVRGTVWGWNPLPQFLASRGYAVIEPEFRGSAGYGQVHLQAGWRQWGRAMQDDIADALLWAVAQGRVDGTRACIMGASYGGYATLMGLARHPELWRCGIAEMAVTDLTRFVGGSWWWRDDIAEEGRRYDLPRMVGDPVRDAEMLRESSPVHQAGRIRAPVLLVHGGLDQRVPIVHARDMRRALQAAGNEPQWLVFDAEGHGWYKPDNRIEHARRVEDFLRQHLGQTPPGAAAAPGVAASAGR